MDEHQIPMNTASTFKYDPNEPPARLPTMTVGELREALKDVGDDVPVFAETTMMTGSQIDAGLAYGYLGGLKFFVQRATPFGASTDDPCVGLTLRVDRTHG